MSVVEPIAVGQIWRDTYGDKSPRNKGRLNQRTVRVVQLNEDGRWMIVGLTGQTGGPIRTVRNTKVTEKTLRAGYVLQENAPATPAARAPALESGARP